MPRAAARFGVSGGTILPAVRGAFSKVIDQMTEDLIGLLTLIINGLIAIALSYLAYKQASLEKLTERIEINTNSNTAQLLEKTKEIHEAIGIKLGRAEMAMERSGDAEVKKATDIAKDAVELADTEVED